MKKKLLYFTLTVATIVTCVFVMALTVSAATTKDGILPFEDVKDSYWYADAAEFCYVNGVISGMDDHTFAAAGTLTRAQFVTMLANIEGINTKAYSTNKFTDVKSSHWYYGAVAWAYQNGIVSGTSETKFSPNSQINRETLSRMMSLYMKKKGCSVAVNNNCLNKFTDRSKISSWATDGMKYTVSAGLISGVTDTTLSPKGIVTRAQAAQILMLYMEKYHFRCNHSFTSPSCTAHGQCSKCGLKNALPLGHNVSNSFNCKSNGQSKCLRCGYWVSASAMPHKYAAATCGKPETCVYCGATRGKPTGNHSWWAATCKNPKMCKVCYKTEGKALGHSWKAANCVSPKTCTRCKLTEGSALTTNKQHTWWAATCKNPKMCKVCYATEGSKAPHTWWAATCTNPKMCKVCYTTEGNALGHSWKAANCVSPKTCTRCKLTEGSALTTNKQHTWWAATCKNPKMCKVCYATEGSKAPHTWWAATCTNPKMCKVCYATEGKALGHSWKAANCVNPKTCTRCKQTEGNALTTNKQHSWWAATCTNPKTCKVCYTTEGKALGHSWWAATCKNPKMCKVCYATEGKPIDHILITDWYNCDSMRKCKMCNEYVGEPIGHDYTPATCTMPKQCTRCLRTTGGVLGHSYKNNKCTRCNANYGLTEADYTKLLSGSPFVNIDTYMPGNEDIHAVGIHNIMSWYTGSDYYMADSYTRVDLDRDGIDEVIIEYMNYEIPIDHPEVILYWYNGKWRAYINKDMYQLILETSDGWFRGSDGATVDWYYRIKFTETGLEATEVFSHSNDGYFHNGKRITKSEYDRLYYKHIESGSWPVWIEIPPNYGI